MLNLVSLWYKYRGLAPLGRVHSDTKYFEELRRVVSFVFKIRDYRIHIKSV